MTPLLIFILGLLIGSFLNVCIYRIPRRRYYAEGEDPIIPPEEVIGFSSPRRSICPSCRTQLLAWHNIPLFSWILLRGRCAFCKTRIPIRYPLVELMTGILSLAVFLIFGPTLTGGVIFVTLAALLVLAFIDYDHYILPDCITLTGTLCGLTIAGLNHFFHIFSHPIVPGLWESVAGAAAGGGFLFLVSEVYFRLRGHEGLGLGDVKLLLMTGSLFGPASALQSIFLGSLLGSLIGGVSLLISRKGARHPIPFGPFLITGTMTYIFWDAQPIIEFFNFINPSQIIVEGTSP